MSCTVVVGGQFGSEGKGKVTAFISGKSANPWVVRGGGPNAGHSIKFEHREVTLRHIPAGVANPNSTLLLSAGSVIDEKVLLAEIEALRIASHRLIIDPMAVLMEPNDRSNEVLHLQHVSSTFSGTGYATMRRVGRMPGVRFSGDSPELKRHARIERVAPLLHQRIEAGEDVIIEGTQGFGLSLLHGAAYPWVTSRDTTAAAFLMEAGVPPTEVSSVVVVARTLPIRVGTHGPLRDEIDWETARQLAGAPVAIAEHGSVTGRPRRVGRFDLDHLKQACRYNGATSIALMGLDRLNYKNLGKRHIEDLTPEAQAFLRMVSELTRVPVTIVGTGPMPDDIFAYKRCETK